jgi:membrane peptidoglycan carboxypeptidase
MRIPRRATCLLIALSTAGLLVTAAVMWAWTTFRLPAAATSGRAHVQLLADGAELAVIGVERGARGAGGASAPEGGDWTPLERIPPSLVAAVIAAEDRRFMRHIGVDMLAMGHAVLTNAREGTSIRGASTITQQLARTLFLSRERTWGRKAREAAIALWLERRYSKRAILEAYLNTVYLGQAGDQPVLGVAAGARHLFGRDLDALTLEDSALLATAIRAPSRAFADVSWRVRARRDVVLQAMAADGNVSEQAVGAALAAPVRAAAPPRARAPWFVQLAREEAAQRVLLAGPERSARVATTLDRELQRVAEVAVRVELEQIERRRGLGAGTLQAAVVAMEPGTGMIRALVGGRDYRDGAFNRAVRARRQPGSLFKPLVYLAAFEWGAAGARPTAVSLVEDEPFQVWSAGREWSPQNIDRQFRGPVTIRTALEASLNVPAARIAQQVGPARVTRLARAFGIESPLAAVPSIALGTSDATVLEMTTAFAAIANGGYRVHPTTLDDLATAASLHPLPAPARVVSPESAFIMTHLLRGVMSRGTGRASARWKLSEVTAGKTGTSDGMRDAWLVGYTPDLVVGVWVGADDGHSIGLTGSEGALPIWAAVMQAAVRRAAPRPFTPPDGIVMAAVDRSTGRRACDGAPGIAEAFREGSEPPACEMFADSTPPDARLGVIHTTLESALTGGGR